MSANIEVIGMAEAAAIVGVSKSNFSAHRSKFSGEGECPAPTAQLSSGPVWAGSDVKAMQRWAKEFAKVRVTRAPAGQAKATIAKKAAAPATKAPAKRVAAPTKAVAKAASSKAPATKRDAAVATAAKGGIKATGAAKEAIGGNGENSPEQPVAKALGASKKAATAPVVPAKKKGLFNR